MEGEFICRLCSHVGPRELKKKGRASVEIILWLLFLIPGLVYSIWCRTGRWYACQECGHPGMVPIGSPMGKDLLAKKQRLTAELADIKT